MKKFLAIGLVLMLAACGAKKGSDNSGLFEVLTMQTNGGATIRFNEILTEEKEIRMLQNDENLRKKIKAEDLTKSNFVIINLGEKDAEGYFVNVKGVTETADKIIITTEEEKPKNAATPIPDIYFFPYTIVKVNSKKPIEIK